MQMTKGPFLYGAMRLRQDSGLSGKTGAPQTAFMPARAEFGGIPTCLTKD